MASRGGNIDANQELVKENQGNIERNKKYVAENQLDQHSGRKKKALNKAVVLRVEPLRFQLYKAANDIDNKFFVLQMLDKTKKDGVANYKLSIYHNNGEKHVLEAKPHDARNLMMVQITSDESLDIPLGRKYNFTLQERLVGWMSEARRRDGPSTITDKFYMHEKVRKRFRSLCEVGHFILFNDRLKGTHKGKSTEEENNLNSIDEDVVVPLIEGNESQGFGELPGDFFDGLDLPRPPASSFAPSTSGLLEQIEFACLDDRVLGELLDLTCGAQQN